MTAFLFTRQIGRETLARITALGGMTLFASEALVGGTRSRGLAGRIVRAIHDHGVRCTPVVIVVGLFTGLVLGLQGYHVLSRFGSESLLGSMVSLTLTRELAPVLAALTIVGQAGSALAAGLGIQRHTEQIDALATMGVNPSAYLVAPVLLAAVLVFPFLTTFFVLVGIWGGYVSGCLVLHLPGGVYWSAVERAIQPADVQECLVKALVFGLLTTLICGFQGYHAHRSALTGASAVSAATTRAVVLSSIAVLAADYLITSLLLEVGHV